MAFEDVRIGELLDARDAASEMLRGENQDKVVTPIEAFVLQAGAHLLSTRDTIYGAELANLTRLKRSTVYIILGRFEEQDRILDSTIEKAGFVALKGSPPRRLYTPTDLGHQVFELFGQ
jgi:hypothetical protein